MNTLSAPKAKKIFDGLLKRLSARHETNPTGSWSCNMTSIDLGAHDIDTILQALESSSASGSVRATRLLRPWNAMTPFHRIPVELLIHIFEMAAYDYYTDRHFKGLLVLARVCIWWLGIVMGSPVLWTKVDDSQSMRSLKRTLQLSGDHPLRAIIGGIRPTSTSIQAARQLAFVCKYIPPWESATLWCSARDLLHLESSNAPALKELILTVREVDSLRAIDLFQGYAPQLSRLSLKRVSLKDWGAGFLRGLRSLGLENIKGAGPSLRQFFQVPRSSPELEILLVKYVRFSTPIDRLAEFDFTPIYLTALHHLNIQRSLTSGILRSIVASKYRDYTVEYNGEDTVLQNVLTQHIRGIPTLLDGAAIITIGDHGLMRLESEASGETLRTLTAYHRYSRYSEVAKWLIAVAGDASPDITLLIIRDEFFEPNHADIASLLWGLPKLLQVEVCGVFEDSSLESLISALSEPIVVPDGVQWLCPLLHTLTLDECQDINAKLLLTMMERRTAASTGEPGRPVPIKRFEVTDSIGMKPEFWERIVEALGQDAKCVLEKGKGYFRDDSQLEVEA
ncbi:hypothetical protein FRB95_009908 [Tulasnella sp. JGI-2019a]|nr:hypothetical protein FRB95_009908 [Tulasnella sp. JGI-2019a]